MSEGLRLTITKEPQGATRVDLMLGERSISRLWAIPFTLRIGAALVRMDGIGGVGTDKEFRNRGYSRRVLEATVAHMRAGDAALSMLYGIPDYYPKFGYATAGPDYYLSLTDLDQDAALPEGWRARPLAEGDMPAVRRLYDESIEGAAGAALRPEGARVWSKLAATAAGDGPDACRVVEDPAGRVAGYAWRCKEHWYVKGIEKHDPHAFVVAEAMAEGPRAADAVLALCRSWAREESAGLAEPYRRVVLGQPPEGHVAAAAMRQSAEFLQRCTRCGESMARVLDVGRLLAALLPELSARVRRSAPLPPCVLELRTDLGDAALHVTPEGISLAGGDERGARLAVCLPQTELARLALGAFPTDDVLNRLDELPGADARQVLGVLFPQRHPHMFLPDRY